MTSVEAAEPNASIGGSGLGVAINWLAVVGLIYLLICAVGTDGHGCKQVKQVVSRDVV